jgi:SAM-dependent methyltransferase
MDRFFLPENYTVNLNPMHYNDSNQTDFWQKEVYYYAKKVMTDNNFKSVVDVGCGSGFKLIKYLGEFDTTGVDTDPCYSMLISRYPSRKWLKSGEPEKSFANHNLECDVIICSDVIEHIVNPINLINYIRSIKSKYVIFSTPDREVLRKMPRFGDAAWYGPPVNNAHVREWTSSEFNNFISKYFEVVSYHHCYEQIECMVFLCKPTQRPSEEQCASLPTPETTV